MLIFMYICHEVEIKYVKLSFTAGFVSKLCDELMFERLDYIA